MEDVLCIAGIIVVGIGAKVLEHYETKRLYKGRDWYDN